MTTEQEVSPDQVSAPNNNFFDLYFPKNKHNLFICH